MGQAKVRRLRVAEAVATGAPYAIEVSARAAARLLERYCLAQGAQLAAKAAIEQANALTRTYDEHLAELVDAPVGAAVHADFVTGVITVTPKAPDPASPSHNGHQDAPAAAAVGGVSEPSRAAPAIHP